MTKTIELDQIDIKILRILIRDARTKLKDVAQECGTSSVTILNKIKRLRKLQVITGSTLCLKASDINLPIMATIGVNIDGNKEQEVLKAIEEQACLVEPSQSIGEYDLCALVFAKNINELDKIAYSIKEKFGIRKVTINVWSGAPQLVFENLDLQPLGKNL